MSENRAVTVSGAATGITVLWRDLWLAHPDHVVLVDSSTGRAWTGAEFEHVTAQAARRLADEGVSAGSPVIVSSSPSDATAICFVALLRIGAVAVPVNTAATTREIAHVVAVSGATLAVTDHPERFDGLVRACQVGLVHPDSPRAEDLDRALAAERALVCFTSGTTGLPKGAPITHSALIAGTAALIECWEWSSDDVLVSALPLFHVHGLLVALAGSLTAGAPIVLLERFDADRVVDCVLERDATLVFGVPTMWARLAESGRLHELSTLRLAISGSAPLSPALFARINDAIGSAPVERYGMTETLIITSTPVRGERRAGTVGVPLPGMNVRIASDGVVEVRGQSVFEGYLADTPNAPLRRDGFTEDGWFRTGDIGEWDGENLRLVGRASELIITGGFNVYPREVEDVVRTDDAVIDVAVVGVPDDTWGEVVVAFVVVTPEAIVDDATLARWEALCVNELAPYKRPRRWNVVADLPRNAMGKVLRSDLRTRG